MKTPSPLPVILTLRVVMGQSDRDLCNGERSEQMRRIFYHLSVLDAAMDKVRELQRIASQGGSISQ